MRVVSEKDVNQVIDSLNRSDLVCFQDVLENALIKYNQDPTRIPERIVVKRPELGATHLFMPSFADKVGIKTLAGSKNGFRGSVSIINPTSGELLGVLNAFTLTAFRTALASTLALRKCLNLHGPNNEITVYGNGPQSYWHVKLTLLLYPNLFRRVQISVRSFNEKSNKLLHDLENEFPSVAFSLVDHCKTDYSNSDVIYGCIPSTEPNIYLGGLSDTKQVFVSLIGSYRPDMFECDDDLVDYAKSRKFIIVDSKEHTLNEAGELIKNGVKPDDCIEIGEMSSPIFSKLFNPEQRIFFCKIVGLSIMDVSVGTEVIERAIAMNIGKEVEF